MTSYVAFATKGLEDVAATELASVLADRLDWLRPGTKHVLFATTGTPTTDVEPIRRLTTVDDVCVVAAESPEVSTADDLRALLPSLAGTAAAVGDLRPLDDTFSVTVTAARTPVGTARDITAVVTETVHRQSGWSPREASRAPVDVRVFLDGAAAIIAVRLLDRPLSDRDYRITHRPGALRPTVAAAMIRLARPDIVAGDRDKSHQIWDPFCGSGTILAEAHLAGYRVSGSDLDRAAVEASQANLATVGVDAAAIEVADAASPGTWHRHNAVDTVVANLPWGKQISLTAASAMFAQVGVGVAQLAARGGRCCLLTTDPDRLGAAIRRASPDLLVVRRRLGLLGQTPTLVIAGR